MPPASLRALVFSMFFVMTSCRAQQIAVMVSSDMVFTPRLLLLGPPPVLLVLLLLVPPGKRCTRSLMAYLPGATNSDTDKEEGEGLNDVGKPRLDVYRRGQVEKMITKGLLIIFDI